MSQCKSCGAPVLWVRTMKGKKMPLDPDLTLEGEMILVDLPDGSIAAVHRSSVSEFDGLLGAVELAAAPGRTSHFATCPNADQHRRAR